MGVKRPHSTLHGEGGWQGGTIPSQVATSPVNAGESATEPPVPAERNEL